MKKLCCLFYLFSNFSCVGFNTEFTLQKSIPVVLGQNRITEKESFYYSIDSLRFAANMFYSYDNEKPQLAGSFDTTDLLYGSQLSLFGSEKNDVGIVVWKIATEHAPLFYIYYIRDGVLDTIGIWSLVATCTSLDALDYSIEDIQIEQQEENIVFTFTKDGEFKDCGQKAENVEWIAFKANSLSLPLNIPKNLDL